MRLFTIAALFSLIAFPSLSQDTTSARVKAGYGVSVAQTQPEFPGGRDSLRVFLRKNVRYPKEARDSSVNGKVWLRFTVDTAGRLLDPAVMKGISPSLDSAALSVIPKMPLWAPATRAGKPVESQYLLQIEFIPPGRK